MLKLILSFFFGNLIVDVFLIRVSKKHPNSTKERAANQVTYRQVLNLSCRIILYEMVILEGIQIITKQNCNYYKTSFDIPKAKELDAEDETYHNVIHDKELFSLPWLFQIECFLKI